MQLAARCHAVAPCGLYTCTYICIHVGTTVDHSQRCLPFVSCLNATAPFSMHTVRLTCGGKKERSKEIKATRPLEFLGKTYLRHSRASAAQLDRGARLNTCIGGQCAPPRINRTRNTAHQGHEYELI